MIGIKICFIFLICSITSCAVLNDRSSLEVIDCSQNSYDGDLPEDNRNTFRMVNYNGCTLYVVWSIRGNIITEIAGDSIINRVYPTKDTITNYFVVKDEAKEGLRYDSVYTPRRFRLDSLLEMLSINESNKKGFESDLGQPSRIKTEGPNNEILIEQYFTKTDKSDVDSIYRFYDNRLRDIGFSFSRKLDMQRNSKLYKISHILLPTMSANGSFTSRSEMTIEIKKVKLKHQEQDKLIEVFNRFEKDSPNYLK